MKKILTILVIMMMVGSVYASVVVNPDVLNPSKNPAFKDVTEYFAPTDVRSLGMGGVGVAAPNEIQSIWYNPAGLAASKVQVSIPSFGATIYNPLGIYNTVKSANEVDDYVSGVLGMLKKGYGKIATVDAQVSFSVGGFGFGVNVQESINTYAGPGSTGGLDSKLFNETSAQAVIGYGYRFNFAKDFSLDVGATVGFNLITYSNLIGASELVDVIDFNNPTNMIQNLVASTPFAAGWSIPVNVGANVNLPLGFKVGAVLKNVNGKYYSEAFRIEQNESGKYIRTNKQKFDFMTPMRLDVGVAWAPEITKAFKPTIAADFVDIIGFFQENNYSGKNIINHLKVGAEIRGLWILDARIGLDRGYWTVGAGLDLWVINVEAAYFWNEFGSIAGEKGIDGLSIRINIGW